jgi:Fic family protein
MSYSPPFELTHTMMRLVAEISQQVGEWTATNKDKLVPKLRKENRIRTIHASLAVEQNTLSLEQVTALVDGKTVLGSPKEIQEVHNAFAVYESIDKWNETSGDDLLEAHAIMMKGLLKDAGQWRNGGAGIYRGDQLVHMAPPANQVPRLMIQLMDWLRRTDAHPLIASAAFHYEFEFIHPFSDGNGRIGRFWQTLVLKCWHPLLAFLPVETVIKARQEEYYQSLREADVKSDCSVFIEFLLSAINESLTEAIQSEEKTRVEMKYKTRVKTADQILDVLKESPNLALVDVANRIGRSVSTVERAVSKLKKEGRLEYQGPKKNGIWVAREV